MQIPTPSNKSILEFYGYDTGGMTSEEMDTLVAILLKVRERTKKDKERRSEPRGEDRLEANRLLVLTDEERKKARNVRTQAIHSESLRIILNYLGIHKEVYLHRADPGERAKLMSAIKVMIAAAGEDLIV